MLNGEFHNTADDKSRVLIPSKMRSEIAGNVLVITRGMDNCLWVFTPGEWEKFSKNIMANSTMLNKGTRAFQRRIIAPAQECEIDKSGRIQIPAALRQVVGIAPKKEVLVLGLSHYIEIWDAENYDAYLEESEVDFADAAESIGDMLMGRS